MYKIKDGFILREVAGNFVVVAVGDRVKEFNGIINLNETSALMWKALEQGTDFDGLVETLIKEYDVDKESVKLDVETFLKKLKENNLLND